MCGGEKTLHVLSYGLEGIGYDTLELPSEVVGEKLLDIHYRGKVFLREPRAALANFLSSDVARIAPGRFSSDTIVLPKSILQELLRKSDLEETSVVPNGKRDRGLKERVGIPHIEQCDALLPNINHCTIECEDVFLARLLRLLFGNAVHDYKN